MSIPCGKIPQFLGPTFSLLEILVEFHIYSIMYKQESPLCGQKFCKIASPQVWKQIFWHKLDCNLPFLADNIVSTSRDENIFCEAMAAKTVSHLECFI